ncbi:MAG TPA: hypothetical protein VMM93_08090 [Vicinamibacterales bacterium]|nr:hypothetical protein [Vicinamibacterales bacterium]
MSDRTAPSLAKLDELIPRLEAAAGSADADRLVDETKALRRAVAAFHLEAIRFRMHAVDRLIRLTGDEGLSRQLFEELRLTLEAAGFHTRSHSAPGH